MKKLMKNPIFMFILGVTMSIGITSVLAYSLFAQEVEFTPTDENWKQNDGSDIEDVKEALDDLHYRTNSIAFKKICKYKDDTYSQDKSNKYSIGTKYECDPGDGVARNFYILTVNNEAIKLIMEHNITEGTSKTTMSWTDAKKYIKNNNLKASWTDVVDIDLPKANEIADAVGNTSWEVVAASIDNRYCLKSKVYDNVSGARCKNNTDYCWLHDYLYFDYEYHCPHILASTEAYGYWTSDYIYTSTSTRYAWRIHSSGSVSEMEVAENRYMGVRPVITIYKSNIVN